RTAPTATGPRGAIRTGSRAGYARPRRVVPDMERIYARDRLARVAAITGRNRRVAHVPPDHWCGHELLARGPLPDARPAGSGLHVPRRPAHRQQLMADLYGAAPRCARHEFGHPYDR